MTSMKSKLGLILIVCVLVALLTEASKMKTQPLLERVAEAEMVFVGKIINKVTDGDWVRAEILVEEPLRNAERGHKITVIWRANISGTLIYDAADGARGIAILKDKHEGRYWLRDDKFENLEKLDDVKNLMEAAANAPKLPAK